MAERLKRNLASAFDPGPDFPHRLWLSRTMAALDLEDRASRGRSGGVRPAWLTPAVAALLAVAIVATLVLVGRGLRSEQTTPGKVGPRSVATSKPIRVDPPTVLDCRTQCPDEAGKLHELPIALTYFSPNAIWGIFNSRSGGPSTIYRTHDGGQHWQAQANWSNPHSSTPSTTGDAAWSNPLEHMTVSADGREALFVTSWGDFGASVFYTKDGGAHWASYGLPLMAQPTWLCHDNLCYPGVDDFGLQAFFLNTHEGWVVSKGSVATTDDIFHTTDSGAHWSLLANVPIRPGFDLRHGQIEFHSSSAGLFVPDYTNDSSVARTVFSTVDGGATWQPRTLGDLPVKRIEIKPNVYVPIEAAIVGVKFFNDRDGVIETQSVTGCGTSGGQPTFCGYGPTYLYATSDGGRNWSAPRLTVAAPIDLVDAKDWIGTTMSGLVRTSDGGQTWQEVSVFGHAESFDFVDPLDGIAWSGYCVLHAVITYDGGMHWNELNLPYQQPPSLTCI